MAHTPIRATDTTICLIDTQAHTLALRALRHSLDRLDFAEALFISDSAPDIGGVKHVPIPVLDGREAYSRFVIKDLIHHVRTQHVLLIQWDGYVVNPAAWTDVFLQYDYIGARWGQHSDGHDVGNGGFSLRSRRLLEALQDREIDRLEPEDARICRDYRPLLESRYGIRFAPPEMADRFSFETTYPVGRPFGFHGLFNMWLFLDDTEVPGFVDAMPRSILGSIQALSLAKNFIDLKRYDAARHLLESRLRVFPADSRCAEMLSGITYSARAGAGIGRNAPCPCGSGKRYKHCCGAVDAVPDADSRAASRDVSGEGLLQHAMVDHQAGRLAEARRGYEAVLARGSDALALHYLGVLDMNEGRPEEGEVRIRTSLAIRDDLPDFHNNLGLCLRLQGRLEEAVSCYRQALELNPSYAPAWSNIGLDLHSLGRLDAALDAFDRALALQPDLAQARFSRALVLLAKGDYLNGWKEYEWGRRCRENAGANRLPPIEGRPAQWQGEDLNGRSLLLIAEQGVGDTFQFIRYAPLLAVRGAGIGLYVREAQIAGLLRSVTGVSTIHTGDDIGPIPHHDYVAHLTSLPWLCGTRAVSDIPADIPYLTASADRRIYWRQRLAGLLATRKIGLAWAGNPRNPTDRIRSCRLDVLRPLFDIPDTAWINLQLGAGREQLSEIDTPVLDWGDELTDYSETAALLSELDLVITVDTSLAHAAGALGRPVWVMLAHAPDFRWLRDRPDSPWYPTARLFRQSESGDWSAVVNAIRSALSNGEYQRERDA